MTSISRSGIGIVTVLAVSGSVIFLAFSKRSIILKNELLKQPAIANQMKHDTREMSKVPLAVPCPGQSEVLEDTSSTEEVRGLGDCCSGSMTGTVLSTTDETANRISDCISTISISSNDNNIVLESVGRTAMDQDLVAVRNFAVIQTTDKYVLPTNPNLGASEKRMDTKASVSVPAISGVRKSSSQKKKVRFAATVVEPKNNNREFRLHPRSSRLSRQSHGRLTFDSCEIRS